MTVLDRKLLRDLWRLRAQALAIALVIASGVALPWAVRAREMLAEQWGVGAEVWSVTSWNELRRDGVEAEHHNLVHPDAEPNWEACLTMVVPPEKAPDQPTYLELTFERGDVVEIPAARESGPTPGLPEVAQLRLRVAPRTATATANPKMNEWVPPTPGHPRWNWAGSSDA